MITYKIKESNEDIKQAVIHKKGHVTEFTLQNMEDNEAQLEKQLREVTSTIENRKAIMFNVSEYHPYVLELSEEQRNAVFLYAQAEGELKEYQKAADEIKSVLDNSAIEKAEIKKQLNIND